MYAMHGMGIFVYYWHVIFPVQETCFQFRMKSFLIIIFLLHPGSDPSWRTMSSYMCRIYFLYAYLCKISSGGSMEHAQGDGER